MGFYMPSQYPGPSKIFRPVFASLQYVHNGSLYFSLTNIHHMFPCEHEIIIIQAKPVFLRVHQFLET